MYQSHQIKSIMEKRIASLEKIVEAKTKSLEAAPEGRLRTSNHRGKTQYFHRRKPNDRNGIYLQEEKTNLAAALAQKDYDERILNAAENEIQAIHNYFKKVPEKTVESIYPELPEARQRLVTPIIEPDEIFIKQWLAQPHGFASSQNSRPHVYNDQGIISDSKSELLISQQFDKHKLVYLPHFSLLLKGYGQVIADFKILNKRTRKEYYWEHLGLMDNPQYKAHNIPKINAYILNGYIPGRNLILTYECENSFLDLRVVDKLIESFLI